MWEKEISNDFNTYYVRTLGCQMNEHDSIRIGGLLEEMGFIKANENQIKNGEITIWVINTCSVREKASTRLYGQLGQLAELKRLNPYLKIVVAGCQAQADKEEIIKKAPYVSAVIGTNDIYKLPKILSQKGDVKINEKVSASDTFTLFPSSLPRTRILNHCAWVVINTGCNNVCTFCIVPFVRGKQKDRPIEQICEEVKQLTDEGVKEVTLLGQNVNSYGYELGDRSAFSKLLKKISNIDKIERIRFMSPHPAYFNDDVINTISTTPKVMPSIHLPLQSGSTDLLRKMARGYSAKRYEEIVLKLRKQIPNLYLTTDIIVGFPGETDDDFEKTYNILRKIEFDSAYIFKYSKRPHTKAISFPNHIPQEIINKRFEKLLKLQNEITENKAALSVGKQMQALITDIDEKKITARVQDNRPVHISYSIKSDMPKLGDIINVNITYAAPHHLLGEIS